MAGPNDDNTNTADMDNPNMMFNGSWTRSSGPHECLIDNDFITSTSTTNSSMSWPFKVDANTLDIVGGGQLSSGALITIQVDDFTTTIDTSNGTFPLVQGATDQQAGQCSYIATIGGIKAMASHTLTITHHGLGKNASPGGAGVLTLSTLIWRQDPQANNLTSIQLIASPSTNPSTPPSSSTSSSTPAGATTIASTPSVPDTSTSHRTLGVAIGVTLVAAAVVGLGLFLWLYLRRRKVSKVRKRGIKIISPPESQGTSFSSMAFEKPAKSEHYQYQLSSTSRPPSARRPLSVELSSLPSSTAESSTSTLGHPPVRRVSRKPVPRPTTAENEDEDVITPLPPSVVRSRPDSDTLVTATGEP